MYKLQDWAAVQKVYRETKSIRATARLLGMARNTVRSLLEANEEPKYNRTVCKSIIEYSCQSGNHSDIIRISFQYYPDAEAAGTGTD